ncbi:group III truncated hemoglobin [Hellea sp.]|nr:group III truncated hemoglobin [Hellea sp.]
MAALLSEADIQRVVRNFYQEVQTDDVLAPMFALKIGPEDWAAHMDHIADFWSSIFLKTARFKGNPMLKHAALPGLTPAHFNRWLALFKDVSARTLKPEQAKAMQTMAENIGQSLQMGLAFNYEKHGDLDHPFKDYGLRRPP